MPCQLLFVLRSEKTMKKTGLKYLEDNENTMRKPNYKENCPKMLWIDFIFLCLTRCPKTVENFCVHSRNGYYNGHTFHRIIKVSFANFI